MQNSRLEERKKYEQSRKPKKVDPNNPTNEDLIEIQEEYNLAIETLEKLRSQGEKLESEYGRIKETVDQATSRPPPKDKTKKDTTPKKPIYNRAAQNDDHCIHSFLKKDKLQTELDQLNAESKILRSKILSITDNQEIKKGIDKLNDLQNTLTQLENEAKEVEKTQTTLQHKHKTLTTEISDLENSKGYKVKVDSLKNEINGYKEKHKEINAKRMKDEREFKIQQEYLTLLEEKYRAACVELGLSASLNFSRAEEHNERNEGKPKPKPLGIPEEMNEGNFNVMTEEYRNMKAEISKNNKEFKITKSKIESQIIELELQNKDFTEKLKEKSKISSITAKKISEIQRLTNPGLQEMEITNKMIRSSIENVKKPISKHVLDTKKRKTRRDVAGNLDATDALLFDDADFFEDDLDHRITRIEILHTEGENGRIVGVQAFYEINFREVAGFNTCFFGQKPERLAIEFDLDDGLKFISGFYSEGIDYLRIESESGKIISYGVVTAREKQSEFHLDVKKDETAITLFGGLHIRKESITDSEYSLFFLGFEVKRQKPVSIGWRHPKGEEEIEERIDNEDLKNRSLRKIFFSRKNVGPKNSSPLKLQTK